MAQNRKKLAVKNVVDTLASASRNLESWKKAPTKGESLASGLNGSEAVWQSEVAQQYYDDIVDYLNEMVQYVEKVYLDADAEYTFEPEEVPDGDKRAEWKSYVGFHVDPNATPDGSSSCY